MTKKYKIIVSVVAALLVLIIAGLAVGLVLVAQQVQMTNAVSVTYSANNVDCSIIAEGALISGESFELVQDSIHQNIGAYDLVTGFGSIIPIIVDGEEQESAIDVIKPHDTNTNGLDYLHLEKEFKDVALNPVPVRENNEYGGKIIGSTSSFAIYVFRIQNNSTRDINVDISYDATVNTNISVKMFVNETNLYYDEEYLGVLAEDTNWYEYGVQNGKNECVIKGNDENCGENSAICYFVLRAEDISQGAEFIGNLQIKLDNVTPAV